MKNLHFKVVGQKSPGNKIVLVTVVPNDFFGEDMPEIFEMQAVKQAPTIYTGTYPTVKFNTDTVEDKFEEAKGSGISGIVMKTDWYNVEEEKEDVLGIGL